MAALPAPSLDNTFETDSTSRSGSLSKAAGEWRTGCAGGGGGRRRYRGGLFRRTSQKSSIRRLASRSPPPLPPAMGKRDEQLTSSGPPCGTRLQAYQPTRGPRAPQPHNDNSITNSFSVEIRAYVTFCCVTRYHSSDGHNPPDLHQVTLDRIISAKITGIRGSS